MRRKVATKRKTVIDIEKEEDEDAVYERVRKSDFKQQRLPAWRPVPTISSVVTVFIIFGIIFLTIGIVLLIFSSKIKSLSVRYDDICTLNTECLVTINIQDDMDKPIMVFYQLDGFFQNSRRYLRSKSFDQLRGKTVSKDDLKDSCKPVVYNKDLGFDPVAANDSITKLNPNDIASPCGLLAKTFFRDSYQFYNKDNNTPIYVNEKDIAFAKDKDLYDKNLDLSNQWIDYTNEHFIVWMRPSGLPNPKKLWGRIEGVDLKKGDSLLVKIDNKYDVSKYKGEKHLVLSTANVFGGKNTFMGICYMIAGGASLVLAIIFAIGFCSRAKEHNF